MSLPSPPEQPDLGYEVGPRTHGPTTVEITCRIPPDAWEELSNEPDLSALAGNEINDLTVSGRLAPKTEVRAMLCKATRNDVLDEDNFPSIKDATEVRLYNTAGWTLVCDALRSDMSHALAPTTNDSQRARDRCNLGLASALAHLWSTASRAGHALGCRTPGPRYIALTGKTFNSFVDIRDSTTLQTSEMSDESLPGLSIADAHRRKTNRAPSGSGLSGSQSSGPQMRFPTTALNEGHLRALAEIQSMKRDSEEPRGAGQGPSRHSSNKSPRTPRHTEGVVEPVRPKREECNSAETITALSASSQDSASGSASTSSKNAPGGEDAAQANQRKKPWNVKKRKHPPVRGSRDVYGC